MVFQISNDLSLQKLAQVSHSYVLRPQTTKSMIFNRFLLISLILHFEIHTPIAAWDNPTDSGNYFWFWP